MKLFDRGPRIGLGCGPLGALDERRANGLLRHALDRGVRVFDCAPSYGNAERYVGAAIAGRRERAIVVTKGGYGVPGIADWTPRCVAEGIERARRVMKIDVVDAFLLHSCPRDVLVGGGVIEPMLDAKRRGLVRAVGYSGDGASLAWAVSAGVFDVLECSVNLFDQAALPMLQGFGGEVLAKRAMGGAPWRFDVRPSAFDAGTYWDRMKARFPLAPPSAETALRFAAWAPGIDCALVGTTEASHVDAALDAIARGPLAESEQAAIEADFPSDWAGIV